MSFPMMVIGSMVPDNTKKVMVMALIAAAIAATPLFMVFFGTKEKKEYMQESSPS